MLKKPSEYVLNCDPTYYIDWDIYLVIGNKIGRAINFSKEYGSYRIIAIFEGAFDVGMLEQIHMEDLDA